DGPNSCGCRTAFPHHFGNAALFSAAPVQGTRAGNVSFPQFFLLAYLDRKEVLSMSEIAKKMAHTTAAASGLVARLENLRYVVRSAARDDRRKVMVCITAKGSTLVRSIREEMVGNLMKILNHLTPDETQAALQIYSKIYDYCQSK